MTSTIVQEVLFNVPTKYLICLPLHVFVKYLFSFLEVSLPVLSVPFSCGFHHEDLPC